MTHELHIRNIVSFTTPSSEWTPPFRYYKYPLPLPIPRIFPRTSRSSNNINLSIDSLYNQHLPAQRTTQIPVAHHNRQQKPSHHEYVNIQTPHHHPPPHRSAGASSPHRTIFHQRPHSRNSTRSHYNPHRPVHSTKPETWPFRCARRPYQRRHGAPDTGASWTAPRRAPEPPRWGLAVPGWQILFERGAKRL